MPEYIVRYDGIQVNRGGDWALADDALDLEAGTFGSYSFTLAPTHPMSRLEAFVTEDASHEVTFAERYGDGQEAELFRGWVKKTSMDTDLMLTVECEGMLAYLKSTVVRPYACRSLADLPDGTEIIGSRDPFDWLVSQHNAHCPGSMQFDVGFNPHVGPVDAGTSWNSTWDELNDKFCSGLDRYLNARTGPGGRRLLDLLDGGAGEGTQVVVLGENVASMDISGESSEIVTAIIPRATLDDSYNQERRQRVDRREIGIEDADMDQVVGNCSTITHDGDRLVNWDMVAAYGYREEKRDYEASSPEDLATLASRDLDPLTIGERTANAIEVDAVDLHVANPSIQPIRLLDWNRIFIRAYGLEDDGAALGVGTGGRLILDQWLPCSKLHISSTHPESSWYRFGDLPQTLTRMSALRMGMLRRGDGTLVRRTDGTEWDSDRIWDHADEIEDGYQKGDEELWEGLENATTEWGQHLDEQFDAYTKQWYESLDEAKKEDAQGREELLKHLDEVEGKWSDELGRMDGELDDLAGTVDSNHRELLDGIRDVAESASRTFFGICDTAGGTASKALLPSQVTRPGGEDFELRKGVVVDVLFRHANEASYPTLDFAGTGPVSIVTNGDRYAVWHDGEVLRFVYDGTYWQNCSNNLYGRTVTVGNPSLANFYTNGNVAELRIGSESYWHAGVDGNRVGLVDRNHIDIQDDHIDFVRPSSILGPSTLRFSYSSYYTGAEISCDSGINIDGGYSHIRIGNDYGSFDVGTNAYNLTSISANQADGSSLSFGIGYNGYFTKGSNWIMRSITTQVSSSEYASFYPSSLGITSFAGYSVNVTNGDANALDFYVVGTQVTANWMAVKFDRVVNGRIRLNILAVPVGAVYQMSDPVLPGPEVFGDPSSTENPQPEAAVDHEEVA